MNSTIDREVCYPDALLDFSNMSRQISAFNEQERLLTAAYKEFSAGINKCKSLVRLESDLFNEPWGTFINSTIEECTSPAWVKSSAHNVLELASKVEKQRSTLLADIPVKCSNLLNFDFVVHCEEINNYCSKLEKIKKSSTAEKLLKELIQNNHDIDQIRTRITELTRSSLLDLMDQPHREQWFSLLAQHAPALKEDGRLLRDLITQRQSLIELKALQPEVENWRGNAAKQVIKSVSESLLSILDAPSKEGWGGEQGCNGGKWKSLLEKFAGESYVGAEELRGKLAQVAFPRELSALVSSVTEWDQLARKTTLIHASEYLNERRLKLLKDENGHLELSKIYGQKYANKLDKILESVAQALSKEDLYNIQKAHHQLLSWYEEAAQEICRSLLGSIQDWELSHLFIGADSVGLLNELKFKLSQPSMALRDEFWHGLLEVHKTKTNSNKTGVNDGCRESKVICVTLNMSGAVIQSMQLNGKLFIFKAVNSQRRVKSWPISIEVPMGVVPLAELKIKSVRPAFSSLSGWLHNLFSQWFLGKPGNAVIRQVISTTESFVINDKNKQIELQDFFSSVVRS